MFAVQAKIKEGEQANRMIFFNRVISGNSSAKWTDGQAIKSVCTWVNKLIAEDDTPGEEPAAVTSEDVTDESAPEAETSSEDTQE